MHFYSIKNVVNNFLFHKSDRKRGAAARSTSPTCSATLQKFKDLNIQNRLSSEIPSTTKLLGSGIEKEVYIGFNEQGPIEGVVYMIAKQRLFNTDGLQKEVEDAKTIKDQVYHASIKKFFKNLGISSNQAKLYSEQAKTSLPTIESLLARLENKTEEPASRAVALLLKYRKSQAMQQLLESNMFLAVDFINAPDVLIQGMPAVIAKKADDDAENAIRKAEYRFPQTQELARQILKGFRGLHAGGYIHGDVKLENVLLYHVPSSSSTLEPVLKLGDWGKCKPISSSDVDLYWGNRRYMPPERLASRKGETFGAAMMIVRILEEEFLKDPSQKMLIEPTHIDQEKLSQLKNENHPMKFRKGIERFLAIAQVSPEIDRYKPLDSVWHVVDSIRSLFGTSNAHVDLEIQRYLGCLQQRLLERYGTSPKQAKAICDKIHVLQEMMHTDPSRRISVKEALKRWES